jgi:hypothetical protein
MASKAPAVIKFCDPSLKVSPGHGWAILHDKVSELLWKVPTVWTFARNLNHATCQPIGRLCHKYLLSY